MAYNDYQAPKYDAKLTREDIKANILADLKAAVVSGDLPACKPTLREGRGGHTLSLTVTLRDLAMPVLDVEYLSAQVGAKDTLQRLRSGCFAEAAAKVLARATAIANAYNFDKSEIETDYFHVGYYLTVEFEGKAVAREREQLIGACSRKRYGIGAEMRSLAIVASDAAMETGHAKLGLDIVQTARRGAYDCREYLARNIDRVLPAIGATLKLRAMEADLSREEDWDTAMGTALQATMFTKPAPVAMLVSGTDDRGIARRSDPSAADKRRAAALKAVATRRANAAKAVAS